MKITAVILFIFLFTTNIFAARTEGLKKNGCDFRTPTKSEKHNALYMSSYLLKKLHDLNKSYEKKGEVFQLAFVARTGTSPGANQLINNKKSYARLFKGLDLVFGPDDTQEDTVEDRLYSNVLRSNSKVNDNRFSHIGIVYKNFDGRWSFIHMLYQCGKKAKGSNRVAKGAKGSSHIWTEGITRFFVDKPYNYGAHIMVPVKSVRTQLYKLLINSNETFVKHIEEGVEVTLFKTNEGIYGKFLSPKYNAISKPFSLRDQNSNQWPLELLAASMAPEGSVRSRAEAHDYLKETGYRPTRLWLKGKYTVAKIITGFIDTVDPFEQNYIEHNLVEVSTVLSVNQYMKKNKVLDQELKIFLPRDLRKY